MNVRHATNKGKYKKKNSANIIYIDIHHLLGIFLF